MASTEAQKRASIKYMKEKTHPGSSPRMRGAPGEQPPARPTHGIIPAHAGSTGGGAGTARRARDHPRACGEHDPSFLHSEGLAMCVELAYNGEIGKSQFIPYVMEELRRRLS